MSDVSIQNRVSEIISELSDCREDERNTQNQILQTVSIVGTILGILFGASYLNSDSKNDCIIIFEHVKEGDTSYIARFQRMINGNVTYARILFWFSLFIFCTAFSYIIILGINNILRYYYIQTLEDRLYELIPEAPDNKDRGYFLHWNAYSARIVTKNIYHITSTHTLLSYVCYVGVILCAILFSAGIVTTLYLEIKSKNVFDYVIMIIAIIAMILTFFLFGRTTYKAREVSQFAWDTAHENQKFRLVEHSHKIYKKAPSFRRILKYLIYPRKQDWQKPILIIVGFVYAGVLTDSIFSLESFLWLLFAMIVFDFLAYQARYQINDIRGLKEDN